MKLDKGNFLTCRYMDPNLKQEIRSYSMNSNTVSYQEDILYFENLEFKRIAEHLYEKESRYDWYPPFESICIRLKGCETEKEFNLLYKNYLYGIRTNNPMYFCKYDMDIPVKWQISTVCNNLNITDSYIEEQLDNLGDISRVKLLSDDFRKSILTLSIKEYVDYLINHLSVIHNIY